MVVQLGIYTNSFFWIYLWLINFKHIDISTRLLNNLCIYVPLLLATSKLMLMLLDKLVYYKLPTFEAYYSKCIDKTLLSYLVFDYLYFGLFSCITRCSLSQNYAFSLSSLNLHVASNKSNNCLTILICYGSKQINFCIFYFILFSISNFIEMHTPKFIKEQTNWS